MYNVNRYSGSYSHLNRRWETIIVELTTCVPSSLCGKVNLYLFFISWSSTITICGGLLKFNRKHDKNLSIMMFDDDLATLYRSYGIINNSRLTRAQNEWSLTQGAGCIRMHLSNYHLLTHWLTSAKVLIWRALSEEAALLRWHVVTDISMWKYFSCGSS